MEDVRKLIVSVVMMSLILWVGAFYFRYEKKHLNYEKNIDSVHSGTIVDKKIENPYDGLFTSHGTRYYIVIGTEYDKPTLFSSSESEKATKSISVSEDVYIKYNVGDFFDSYKYDKTSEEQPTITDITSER